MFTVWRSSLRDTFLGLRELTRVGFLLGDLLITGNVLSRTRTVLSLFHSKAVRALAASGFRIVDALRAKVQVHVEQSRVV